MLLKKIRQQYKSFKVGTNIQPESKYRKNQALGYRDVDLKNT